MQSLVGPVGTQGLGCGGGRAQQEVEGAAAVAARYQSSQAGQPQPRPQLGRTRGSVDGTVCGMVEQGRRERGNKQL